MKRIIPLFFLAVAAFAQVNVQKTSGTNAITGNIVIGDGKSVTSSGSGSIIATAVTGNITASGSAGVLVKNSTGTTVATFGAGPGINVAFAGGATMVDSLVLSAGSVRLPSTYGLLSRNAANSAWIPIVTATASDVLEFGSGGYASDFKGAVTISHATTNSLFLGSNAGTTSTGIWTTGIGTDTAAENTGDKVTAVGYRAAMENTGHYVNAFGDGAAQYNISNYSAAFGNDALMANVGAYSNAFGWAAGRYNRGIAANLLGWNSGRYNLGGYVMGIGASTLQYNDAPYNTALGVNAFSLFRPDGAGAKAFSYTAITVISGESTITIPSHDFGSSGEYVMLKFTQGTAPIGGLTNGDVLQWYVVDSNTIRTTASFNITSAGTGTGHSFTPQHWITNTTAVGANAEPDASNQVLLGDVNVTQVKTPGIYIGSGLSITGQSDLTGSVYVNNDSIYLDNTRAVFSRNAADNANVPLINLNSSDVVVLGAGGYPVQITGNLSVSTIAVAGNNTVSISTNGTVRLTVKGNGVINIASLPTSASGLSSGDLWNNSGVLTVVP